MAYQTLTVVSGAVNQDRTKGLRLKKNPHFFLDIEEYHLKESKLKNLSTCRLAEDLSTVLVTQNFVDTAEAAKLLGFFFDPIWPLGAKAPDPTELKAKSLERSQAKTLLVCVPSQHLDETRNAIAEALILTEPNTPYLGGLAGELADTEGTKILLPCPNPKKLLTHITPLLRSLPWGEELSASTYDSPYWDEDAMEKPIKLP